MEPEKPTKSAPKAKRATPKTAAKRPPENVATTRRRPVRSKTEPAPTPPPVFPEQRTTGRSMVALHSAQLLGVVAAVAAAVFLLVGGDDQPGQIRPDVANLVSGSALAAFAAAHETQVYWAGNMESRKLELTTTRDGTFLRYLVSGASAGAAEPALTVATYPLTAAYATATRRAKSKGMTSRRIADGGIAVWSGEQPTSVYVASRGVPYLVEVYAPSPAEARTLALSGRIRPIR